MIAFIVGVLLLLIVFFLAYFNVKIVPRSKAYVIDRFGKFWKVWEAGLNWKWPIVSRVVKIVDLKEEVSDYPPMEVITKDNITINIDAVVYHKVVDPEKFTYKVANPEKALQLLSITTLRNQIAGMKLIEALSGRDKINLAMVRIMNNATLEPWGIEVTRVEVKNIDPPDSIKYAMEKAMKAEREKEAAIASAEGEKEAAILRAQALRDSAILKKEAEAAGIRILKKEGLTAEQIVRLQSLDALQKVSEGNATKIIIPSDLQNLTGLVTSLKESTDTSDPKPVTAKKPVSEKMPIDLDGLLSREVGPVTSSVKAEEIDKKESKTEKNDLFITLQGGAGYRNRPSF